MKRIYLDHASTTYLAREVKTAMEPYWVRNFGNPSSIYDEGRIAKKAIADSRSRVAEILGCRPDEIIFTCGGTESDNLGILGASRANKSRGKHIVTLKTEHHAVLHSFDALKKEGFETTLIDVDSEGFVDLKKLSAALKENTILVSVAYANNEIGAIQPMPEIAKIIREHRRRYNSQFPLFHTDAIQAAGYLDLNVEKLGVDLLSLNGSKIYGPKGVGALYIRRGVNVEPIIYGGGQERNLRSGTENVPGIIGFAKALELVQKNREKESGRLIKLRDYFIKEILKRIPDATLNGPLPAQAGKENRLPNNINISFYGIEGEAAVLYLDAKGISCSTGSACSSTSLEPSHVIMSLHRSYEYAHGSLRFSLGKITAKKDLDYVLEVLPGIIKKLREISALDKNYGKN